MRRSPHPRAQCLPHIRNVLQESGSVYAISMNGIFSSHHRRIESSVRMVTIDRCFHRQPKGVEPLQVLTFFAWARLPARGSLCVAREPSSRSVNDEADCERFCTVGRYGAPVVSDQRGILKQFRAVTSSPHPFQAPAQILTPRTPALPHCLWSGFAGRRAHLSAGSSLWFGSNGMGEHSSTPEGQASNAGRVPDIGLLMVKWRSCARKATLGV